MAFGTTRAEDVLKWKTDVPPTQSPSIAAPSWHAPSVTPLSALSSERRLREKGADWLENCAAVVEERESKAAMRVRVVECILLID